MEMTPHPGITMHKIPVEGGAGLLYVLGTLAVALLALPQLAPLATVGLAGGLLLAPVLYRWRARSLTSLNGGLALFVAATAVFVGFGNGAFRALAVTALVAGALFAEIRLRHVPQHPSIAVR
jgi:hypothetical protein